MVKSLFPGVGAAEDPFLPGTLVTVPLSSFSLLSFELAAFLPAYVLVAAGFFAVETEPAACNWSFS